MLTYNRIRPTDPAPAGATFRATWTRDWFAKYSFFPPDLVGSVRTIQERGPSRGFYTVSSPAVSPGDDSFVLDLRTNASWAGTAAVLAVALDGFSALDLTRLELVPAGETADQAAGAREKVQAQAEKAADHSVLDAAADVATGAAKSLRTVFIAATVIALVVAALVYAPELKAAGRAAGKLARKVSK